MDHAPAEARALAPGDRIRLRPSPSNLYRVQRDMLIVATVEFRAGSDDVRIVSVERFRFVPWAVEGMER